VRTALTGVWQLGRTEVGLELHQAVDAQALERRRPENRHGSLETLHSSKAHCYGVLSESAQRPRTCFALPSCEGASLDQTLVTVVTLVHSGLLVHQEDPKIRACHPMFIPM